MSMNDQFREMQIFRDELTSFNDNLKNSVSDLETQHDSVSPL